MLWPRLAGFRPARCKVTKPARNPAWMHWRLWPVSPTSTSIGFCQGKGEMRPAGLLPGAVLANVLMVDQYELGTSLAAEMVIGQIPFSRSFLEGALGLKNSTRERLLVVEAGSNLFDINRRDLVLFDRGQASLGRDGIYLIDLPGIELRGIFLQPDGTVRVVGPDQQRRSLRSEWNGYDRGEGASGEIVMKLEQFVLAGRRTKIVGRAVWISRAL